MLLNSIKKIDWLRSLYIRQLSKNWIEEKVSRFEHLLGSGEKIVDIGSGNGLVAYLLQNKGFDITAVDVEDHAVLEEIKTTVYDGQNLPFKNRQFDVALLLTVLHHTDDPVVVLRETARVAKKIVIIEDVYRNNLQKILTFAMDTLVNLGHSNMTYQNRSVVQWKSIFKDLGLEVLELREKRVLLFFRQATFLVQHSK